MLVVGDAHTLKVHVHTDEPEHATTLFDGAGTVSRLDVADMHEQVAHRTLRVHDALDACGVLAVVNGDGMRELFEGLGARVLDGGATLNPSTYELLAGIHEVPAEEVVVLPNSPNVRMAAERAAELSEKPVRVVPTRSMASGLAAAVALDPASDSAAATPAAIEETLRRVRTGGVTEAARDDTQGRFRRGDSVGFIDEELVAWGEPGETLEVVPRRARPRGRAADRDRGRRRPAGRRGRGRAGAGEHRGRARARRPAGLVVARLRRVAQRRGTTTTGHAARRMQPPRDAAEQHAPHRPVAA